jgi:hypothetical protein
MRASSIVRTNNSVISGMNQHVVGDYNIVSGMGCTVEGNHNKVSGMNARVKGNHNKVSGMCAVVDGDDNIVSGMNANARGKNNMVTGMHSTNNGELSKTKGGNMVFNNASGSTVTTFGRNGGIVVQNVGDRDVKYSLSGATIGCVGDNATVYMNGDNIGILEDDSSGPTTINVNSSGVTVKKNKSKKKKAKRASTSPEIVFVEGPNPNDAKDDTPTDVENESCIVCLTNKRNCIVLPCKHMTLCVSCAVTLCSGVNKDEIKKVGEVHCPSCRGECVSIGKVFQ